MKQQATPKATPMNRRTLLRSGAVLATGGFTAPLLAACGSSGSSSGPETVSVRFNWTIKGEFSPFFVAREKGYYSEQGLNVSLQEGKSGTQAVQVVASGQDDFAYVPSIQACIGINKGVPVKTVATTGRYTGMCWAAWPDVPLEGPESLEGHTASISTSSTFYQVWPGFKRKFRPDPAKIDIVHPSPSARKGLFLRKKLDIMADIFYANDWVILQEEVDEKLNMLRMSELDFDPLGYLLIGNTSLLSSSPDTVRRFVGATIKGFRYTMDHPGEAADIMSRLYGDRLSHSVFAGQINNMLDLLLKDPGLGRATDSIWNSSLGILNASGIIDKKLPPNQYYTNEFLP